MQRDHGDKSEDEASPATGDDRVASASWSERIADVGRPCSHSAKPSRSATNRSDFERRQTMSASNQLGAWMPRYSAASIQTAKSCTNSVLNQVGSAQGVRSCILHSVTKKGLFIAAIAFARPILTPLIPGFADLYVCC